MQEKNQTETERAIIAYFDNTATIHSTLDELTEIGVDRYSTSLLAADSASQMTNLLATDSENGALEGAAAGTGVGATLGLLGAIAVIPVPGVGPFAASGIMATATGGVVGSYLGALFGARAENDSAMGLIDKANEGGAFLIVPSTINDPLVLTTLKKAGGEYVDIYDIKDSELEVSPR